MVESFLKASIKTGSKKETSSPFPSSRDFVLSNTAEGSNRKDGRRYRHYYEYWSKCHNAVVYFLVSLYMNSRGTNCHMITQATFQIPPFCRLVMNNDSYHIRITFSIKGYMRDGLDRELRPIYRDHLTFFTNKGREYVQVWGLFPYTKDIQTTLDHCYNTKNRIVAAMAKVRSNCA